MTLALSLLTKSAEVQGRQLGDRETSPKTPRKLRWSPQVGIPSIQERVLVLFNAANKCFS